MCCCQKPSINGQDEYSWDGKSFSIRKPFFPTLEEGDELIKDLPGRCGGIDSHSHDLRLVKRRGDYVLLVHHGGGEERIELHAYGLRNKGTLEAMTDDAAYWTLLMVYHVQQDAARKAQSTEHHRWSTAAAEKRIKTRKQPRSNYVKVWIEPSRIPA